VIVFVLTCPPSLSLASITVPGTANPWLAGMPNGTTIGPDSAPTESPVLVTTISIIPGTQLVFSVTGGVHFGVGPPSHPDGDPSFGFSPNTIAPVHGMSNVSSQFDALLGVFLGNAQPDTNPAPTPDLDFSPTGNVPGGIDYLTLSPQLQQVFFIGDGLTSASVMQCITVPDGATRLFLGSHDGFGWFNNTGAFEVDVQVKSGAVPEPATFVVWLLLGVILAGRMWCVVLMPERMRRAAAA
jgi:hypothetical protein